jgi:hypothetical protein
MRYFLIIILFTVIAGCTSTSTTKEELTGCDHPSGWCKEIRDIAQESFIYAQMATNAYGEKAQFKLPKEYSLIKMTDNDSIGFAYAIYKNNETNTLIISFRGTEGLRDWWYGNLLASQNESGLDLFDQLKKEHSSDTKFAVVGHSLGGGIALEVSLKRENVEAYVFNTSPRFSADGYNIENKRVSIVEHGEVLKALRAPFKEASQKYTSIGCSSGGPISQHEQAKLASCLTQIAAIGSEFAKASLQDNGIKFIYN